MVWEREKTIFERFTLRVGLAEAPGSSKLEREDSPQAIADSTMLLERRRVLQNLSAPFHTEVRREERPPSWVVFAWRRGLARGRLLAALEHLVHGLDACSVTLDLGPQVLPSICR